MQVRDDTTPPSGCMHPLQNYSLHVLTPSTLRRGRWPWHSRGGGWWLSGCPINEIFITCSSVFPNLYISGYMNVRTWSDGCVCTCHRRKPLIVRSGPLFAACLKSLLLLLPACFSACLSYFARYIVAAEFVGEIGTVRNKSHSYLFSALSVITSHYGSASPGFSSSVT